MYDKIHYKLKKKKKMWRIKLTWLALFPKEYTLEMKIKDQLLFMGEEKMCS